MEIVESLEHGLIDLVTLLKLVLEAIAVFMVAVGLVRTGQLAIQLKRRGKRLAVRGSSTLSFVQVRCQFGMWLALALEFQLGADILATTIAPSFEALGKLGAIALIRTFLNYFLNQELEAENRYQEKFDQEHSSNLASPAPERRS